MNSKAHLPSTQERAGCSLRALGRLSGDTLDKLAEIWSKWSSKYVDAGHASVWGDVEDKIDVARVECQDLLAGFGFHGFGAYAHP